MNIIANSAHDQGAGEGFEAFFTNKGSYLQDYDPNTIQSLVLPDFVGSQPFQKHIKTLGLKFDSVAIGYYIDTSPGSDPEAEEGYLTENLNLLTGKNPLWKYDPGNGGSNWHRHFTLYAEVEGVKHWLKIWALPKDKAKKAGSPFIRLEWCEYLIDKNFRDAVLSVLFPAGMELSQIDFRRVDAAVDVLGGHRDWLFYGKGYKKCGTICNDQTGEVETLYLGDGKVAIYNKSAQVAAKKGETLPEDVLRIELRLKGMGLHALLAKNRFANVVIYLPPHKAVQKLIDAGMHKSSARWFLRACETDGVNNTLKQVEDAKELRVLKKLLESCNDQWWNPDQLFIEFKQQLKVFIADLPLIEHPEAIAA